MSNHRTKGCCPFEVLSTIYTEVNPSRITLAGIFLSPFCASIYLTHQDQFRTNDRRISLMTE